MSQISELSFFSLEYSPSRYATSQSNMVASAIILSKGGNVTPRSQLDTVVYPITLSFVGAMQAKSFPIASPSV